MRSPALDEEAQGKVLGPGIVELRDPLEVELGNL